MVFRLNVRNFKSLRNFAWSPSGVSVLVGPNGSGKTTTLKLLEALRLSFEVDFAAGLDVYGPGPLRSLDAGAHELCAIEVSADDLSWTIVPERSTRPHERVRNVAGDELVLRGRGEREIKLIQGEVVLANEKLALRRAWDSGADIGPLVRLIERSRYYGRHHIDELVDIGSPQSRETQLETHGRNLFAVLRNWRDLSEHEHRWNFVLERLRDSFPWLRRLDFDSLGQRVSAQAIRTKSSEEKLSPSDWPDGFFVSLLQLTAVASGDAGGVVAIDEPENSLHPRLIRALIEAMRDWSAARDVTVLLATHSPVVLDCYSDAPEQVFVMQPELDQLPAALDELRKREWLEHYSLGDLYSQLEIGAPSDANL